MLSRHGVLAVVLGATALLAISGCKGSDSGTGGSGGGGGAQDQPVILPPNSNGQSCQNGEGSCDDQASIDAYADCIVTTCDPQYKQCFGDDYLTGSYGGDCKDLMECAILCQDCDQACLSDCSNQHFSGACKSCITGPIFDCAVEAITSGKCPLPCLPGGGGGVCDDLKACCASLSGQEQTDCQSTYDQIKIGGDFACQQALDTYKQAGKCP